MMVAEQESRAAWTAAQSTEKEKWGTENTDSKSSMGSTYWTSDGVIKCCLEVRAEKTGENVTA